MGNSFDSGEKVNPKRRYSRPKLQTYGSVSEFTHGNTSTGTEGNGRRNSGSDPSIKQDIVRIGEHPLGFGLYLFDYKPEFRNTWGYGRQFGVMADEVARFVPEAVHTCDDGYFIVDYFRLGIIRH